MADPVQAQALTDAIAALAAAVAGRRFINAEDEEEEWREAAPGL